MKGRVRIEYIRADYPKEIRKKIFGKRSSDTWTRIYGHSTRFVVPRKMSREEAIAILRKYEPEAVENPVPGLDRSLRRFKEFNRRDARHLRQVKIPDDAPLIRIGKVPMVTYISSKTGRRQAYKHETNRRSMPTAYAHPTQPFMLLFGGSMRVRDWLYH